MGQTCYCYNRNVAINCFLVQSIFNFLLLEIYRNNHESFILLWKYSCRVLLVVRTSQTIDNKVDNKSLHSFSLSYDIWLSLLINKFLVPLSPVTKECELWAWELKKEDEFIKSGLTKQTFSIITPNFFVWGTYILERVRRNGTGLYLWFSQVQ